MVCCDNDSHQQSKQFMTEKNLLSYKLNGVGGGSKLTKDTLLQWQPTHSVLWLHCSCSDPDAEHWLEQKSHLDKIILSAMLAEESRPRSIVTEQGILVILRGVNHNTGEDIGDMVSIRVWIDEHCIITTYKRELLCIFDIQSSIEQGCGPKNPIDFLKKLTDCMTDHLDEALDTIETQVDKLEEDTLSVDSKILRPQISELCRLTTNMRRYIAPQRDALNGLYLEEPSLLSTSDKLYFREAVDRSFRQIEELDSIRERMTIAREELSSRISEQMNQRMCTLSVVAIIFLPLSFITGLLGINVAGIPGQNHPWAFWMISTALLGILLLFYRYFRRNKWM